MPEPQDIVDGAWKVQQPAFTPTISGTSTLITNTAQPMWVSNTNANTASSSFTASSLAK